MIGLALATVQVSRTLLPPLWGLYAERLTRTRPLLVIASILAGSCLIGLNWGGASIWVYGLLFMHGLFLVPLLPLAETLTLRVLGPRRERYGQIRLWGSVGFIVSTLGLGYGSEMFGLGDHVAAWAMGLPLVLGGVLALTIPSRATAPEPRSIPKVKAALPGALFLLILAAGLGQGSHGPYYAFFTIQLEQAGVERGVISLLWGWGVAAEVVVMALAHRIVARWGLWNVLRAGLLLGGLRWALFASAPGLIVLAAGQTLHAASFALLHVATIQLVDHYTPKGRKVLGQSLISAGAYGGAIGLGVYLAGQAVGSVGYSGLYIGSAAACGAGLLASAWLRPCRGSIATRG